ncbi:MAG TPA: DUF6457 domain-containing protein [Solirubrobacterales bacterium]|nr:DUF6457 domain-containing protein [Solirubrobacterales bacterium]
MGETETGEDWIRRFAAELGLEAPGEWEFEQVLELASVAAHSSERKAAPVACWLFGLSGRSVEEAIEIAKRT